jgi:NADPH2:quinone reductase
MHFEASPHRCQPDISASAFLCAPLRLCVKQSVFFVAGARPALRGVIPGLRFGSVKAAFINQTGPPENIIYGDLPKPVPGPGQCLVKVSAVDVNPIDVYIRAGLIPAQLTFPFVLGHDFAGVIAAAGSGANRFKAGDRVWTTAAGAGSFAEFAVADENLLYPTPPGVSDEQIVALSLVGITAHLGLVTHARVAAGETLFVNGGTGGVGSAVVQMAKILGLRVITTAGSDDKVAQARALGADLAINYRTENIDARIREFAANGVNVWWETLREPDFERTIPLLAKRGRMVLMAGRDAKPVFPVGPFYTKDCSVHGFAVFNSTLEEQRAAAVDIGQWVSEGRLKAQIDRVLPLSEAAQAHRLQEESTVHNKSTLKGKIILKV